MAEAFQHNPAGVPRPVPPATPAPVLAVRGFSKDYGGAPAVRELDFEVGAGEILGLVGPNGAGKTTTLRSIAGILPIKQGASWSAGTSIARDEQAAKRASAGCPTTRSPSRR